ncbi:monothiol glutaredoxin-S16 [Pyrus ussuriensis x Pyrus communis]|uniref:Monothiol glutaredoxin-S16 n=1 Tax=Pyrus ussuriensis x Pyrus communis TaxID=2448454 RepID=A0A5N5HUF8_9ROSA|nr:monothiol glutaredoxin-S16 [Pyrus ussuriensis x Pyrus communis]
MEEHIKATGKCTLEELIDRLVNENKVVAFIKGSRSAPLCGSRRRLSEFLKTRGWIMRALMVLDEEYNRGLRETLKKYSTAGRLSPRYLVNGELLGGCDISKFHAGEGRACQLV